MSAELPLPEQRTPPPAGPITGAHRAASSALWVCLEGINGVGKTTAARTVAAQLGTRCRLLDELTDQPGDTLPGQVIAAMSSHRDPFLRTGHPVAEALALLGLQVRKSELLAGQDLAGVEVVLEDRGVDTIAVYQGVILSSHHSRTSPQQVAQHVLASVRPWVPLPDATLLLLGDPAVCSQRFAERIGHPLDPADRRLLEQMDALYRAMAVDDPARYTVLDVTDLAPDESAAAVAQILCTLLKQRETAHA